MLKLAIFDVSNIKYNGEKIGSPYFCQRVNDYKTTTDKTRCFYGYVLLKNLLKEINIELDNLNIITNQFGKPIAENLKYDFSISHSKNLVAVAVSNQNIGLDVQVVRDCNQKVAERYFSKFDNVKLNSSKHQDLLFTKLWTKYESSLKLFGCRKNFCNNAQPIKHKFKALKDKEKSKYFLCLTTLKSSHIHSQCLNIFT